MKRTLSMLTFSGIVALGLVAGISPGQASALSVSGAGGALKSVAASGTSDVVKVDNRKRRWHRRHHRRHWRHHRPGSGFYFEFGTGGYRHWPPVVVRPPYYAPAPIYRPRYVPPRHARGLPTIHVRWCYNRYRSYRDWDNTFQPYHGPRKQCRSPYWG